MRRKVSEITIAVTASLHAPPGKVVHRQLPLGLSPLPVRTRKTDLPSTTPAQLLVNRNAKGEIRRHLRGIGLGDTPEERVLQQYACTLVNEYG